MVEKPIDHEKEKKLRAEDHLGDAHEHAVNVKRQRPALDDLDADWANFVDQDEEPTKGRPR